MELTVLGLEVIRQLGSGSFAKVYECFDQRESKSYAVKVIGKEALGGSKQRFHKEAEILSGIEHRNVVRFHSFLETETCLVIKMQLVAGGTLRELMEQRWASGKSFLEGQIAELLRGLLEGLKHLHSLNIIHRDIKPGKYLQDELENVLLADSNSLSSIKIADFGLSAQLQQHQHANMRVQCGTLLYMAPEVFSRPSYTKAVDIWACSVITYMLFNQGRHPFYKAGMSTNEFKICLQRDAFPLICHKLAQNFLQRLSKKDYEQRYSVGEALKHPWITRNLEDEVPLSIHESYQGFDSTQLIIHTLKLFISLSELIPHKRRVIIEQYRQKIIYASTNQQRLSSPSRKTRNKGNDLLVRMKQILQSSQDVRSSFTPSSMQQIPQQHSPTLKKHVSFFQSIFEKEKTGDNRLARHHDIRKIEMKGLQSHYQLVTKEEIISQLLAHRARHEEDISDNKFPEILIKNQQQCQQLPRSFQSSFRNSSKKEGGQKRRIFQKKQSIEGLEERQASTRQKGRIKKKYSYVIQAEKFQVKREQQFSLSSKLIPSRRGTSQSKTGNSTKFMVFNSGGKGFTQTWRK